jgi:hypothetical protein
MARKTVSVAVAEVDPDGRRRCGGPMVIRSGVEVHDFADDEIGNAILYGVIDLSQRRVRGCR